MNRALARIEKWRPVTGYEARYEVSDLGNVRSLAKMRPLIGHLDRDGYRRVTLWTPDGQATKKVHQLVCEAFHGPPSALHREVAHLDGSRINNIAGNLKWVSHAENVSHRRLHDTHQIGARHPNAKLSEAQAKEIHQRAGSGENMAAIAREFGLHASTVRQIRTGKRWGHLQATKAGKAPRN